MMKLEEFISVFADQFDDTDRAEFKPETRFKELDEWSSLTALTIIAMVDEECKKSISSDVIRNSETIEDLYNKIYL